MSVKFACMISDTLRHSHLVLAWVCVSQPASFSYRGSVCICQFEVKIFDEFGYS